MRDDIITLVLQPCDLIAWNTGKPFQATFSMREHGSVWTITTQTAVFEEEEGETDRQRHGDRERQRDRETETDRQTDRQTETERQREEL